jgi:hypothetical protein|tara:strand:+ start:61 stop:744 length:684 start_codon:yes stop_codon:yes gene_type:complete
MTILESLLYSDQKKVKVETNQPSLEEVGEFLRKSIDWNAVFGICEDLRDDPFLKSRADNFITSTMKEKAIVRFCIDPQLKRVDKEGCDLEHVLYEGIELKTKEKLFRKGFSRKTGLGPGDTYPVKIKNYLGGEIKDDAFLNRHKEISYTNYVLLVQTGAPYDAAVVTDEYCRSCYYLDGDGIFADFRANDMYRLNLQGIVPKRQGITFSSLLAEAEEKFFSLYETSK